MQMTVETKRCDPDCDIHRPIATLHVADDPVHKDMPPDSADAIPVSVAEATPETDQPSFDPQALQAALLDLVGRVYDANPMHCDPDPQLVVEITKTIQKLSRTGAQNVIESGLASAIESVTTLTLRLQTSIVLQLNRIDQLKGGREGYLLLTLAPEIQNLLLPLADLSHLLVRLADSYSKFQHLNALAGGRHGKR